MTDQELINTADRFYVSLTSVRRRTLDSGAVGIIDLECWVQNSENHLGKKRDISPNDPTSCCCYDIISFFTQWLPLLQWMAQCLSNVSHRWHRRPSALAHAKQTGKKTRSRRRSNDKPATSSRSQMTARWPWRQVETSEERECCQKKWPEYQLTLKGYWGFSQVLTVRFVRMFVSAEWNPQSSAPST